MVEKYLDLKTAYSKFGKGLIAILSKPPSSSALPSP